MLNTSIVAEPLEVESRLLALGLKQNTLVEALRAGHTAKFNCSALDPKITPGTDGWSRTVRALRRFQIPEGWIADEDSNYSPTVCEERKIRVVVATGDYRTGAVGPAPRLTSDKGLMTKLAVRKKSPQIDYLEHLKPRIRQIAHEASTYETWWFLILLEEAYARAELALPRKLVDLRTFDFAERIILPVQRFEPELGKRPISEPELETEQEFDVQIRRKKSGQ